MPAKKRFKPAVRFEMDQMGELVPKDTTSSRQWFWFFQGREVHLLAELDDATRKLLAARFFLKDSTHHNMEVSRETIEKYGLPLSYYTDNDSILGAKIEKRSYAIAIGSPRRIKLTSMSRH